MKRDSDLLRELLLRYESDEKAIFISRITDGSDLKEKSEHYHILLLADKGLVAAVGQSTFRLTSQGHDFIEATRDGGIWNKTKSVVAETGGNATIEVLKALAIGFLKQKIAKHTGKEF
ncbi:MAG: DUF2513 domain-containing protein [Pseudomonadota bacterium]